MSVTDEVLEILARDPQKTLSGEMIAQQLQISLVKILVSVVLYSRILFLPPLSQPCVIPPRYPLARDRTLRFYFT